MSSGRSSVVTRGKVASLVRRWWNLLMVLKDSVESFEVGISLLRKVVVIQQ